MRPLVVAAAVLLVAAGCGSSVSEVTSRPSAGPPRSNEKVLTRAQSERLVRWAGELRSCLRERGYAIGDVQPARTRIELAVPAGTAFQPLLRDGVACGESLGDPPPGSSLQQFPRLIVLYLPKRCLLDPDVAATAA
jgi:uncharacterized protein YceK